jgi:PAS domain S-box-containing protein
MNANGITATDVDTENKPCSVINENGTIVWANRVAEEELRTTTENLLGAKVGQFVPEMKIDDGKKLARVLSGETLKFEREMLREDGSTFFAEIRAEPIETDGNVHCLSSYEKTAEWKPPRESSSKMEHPDPTDIDDIPEEEIQEIAQNIRIDAPSGDMPLNMIILDLLTGHNELEQYKNGSLALYKSIDQRLQEEKQKNSDEKVIKVLKAVKRSAFGLHLRLKRGDEELYGNRDGEYSGYFNPT